MKNRSSIKQATLVLASLFVSCLSVYAQKLPNIQKTSVYAPANVKTDGKTNEWDNKFKAMNNAIQLYYTIANDNEKLYLTLQGTDAHAISKMLNGGITFTIRSYEKMVKPAVIDLLLFVKNGITGVIKKVNDPTAKLDSVLGPVNQQIAAALKEIGVKGVHEIPDTLVSAYNEYGIKEAVQYDNKRSLTVELSIPLKYIQPLIGVNSFKYNIMLNGMKLKNMQVVINGKTQENGGGQSSAQSELMSKLMNSSPTMQDEFNATDFSGTYILAKK